MNPIFQAVVGAMIWRKRTCPKCKRSQITPAGKKGQSVRCKFCGAEVPPIK